MQTLTHGHVSPQLSRALEAARGTTSGADFLVVDVPVGRVALERAFLGAQENVNYWQTGSGDAMVSGGVAECVHLEGGQLDGLKAAILQLAARVRQLSHEGPRLRLFGGIAFDPTRPAGALWQPFGSASFVLPRYAVERTAEQDWFRIVVPCAELERGHDVVVEAASRWLAELLSDSPLPEEPRLLARHDAPDNRQWQEQVRRVKEGIAAGRWDKVVLARTSVCEFNAAPSATRILQRLNSTATSATRFALRRGTATFMGATPEWLVRKRGDQFWTEAMAGSIATEDDRDGARLLASAKDRAEQRVVVEEIERRLRPLAESLTMPAEPQLRRLRDIVHLHTPISGRLRHTGMSALDLVHTLHPTPAVGGVPTQPALELIAALEPVARGWYAGPLGWLDTEGDGEFVVALRSGLMSGRSVHLYAGAGIVHASDADAEYQETHLKLASMLSALGVTPTSPG